MWRIASWNINSLNARLPHVLRWLDDNQPDALALQETKTQDENFPDAALREQGYQAVFAGQKSYNGVALLSKRPAQVLHAELPDFDDPQKRVLCAMIDEVCVLNLYVPNGAEVGSEKYGYKLDWLRRLDGFVAHLLTQGEKLVALGDFNIAPKDEDIHDPQAWRDKILCSGPEREALDRLAAQGLADTFRLFEQEEDSFSWWDYRDATFSRNMGLRIDLIFASPALSRRCADSWIDAAPRAWERPSDHAPVVAEFRL